MNVRKVFPSILFSLLLNCFAFSDESLASQRMQDRQEDEIRKFNQTTQRIDASIEASKNAINNISNKTVSLKSVSSGCYLNGRANHNDEVWVSNKGNDANMYFEWTIQPSSKGYNVKSTSSGCYLNGRGKDGDTVWVSNKGNDAATYFQWEITPISTGIYALKSVSSNSYLDGRDNHNAPVLVTNRNPSGDRYLQWVITPE